MIITRLIQTTVLYRFSYLRAAFGALIIPVSYAEDLVAGVIICGVPNIGVGVLAGMSVIFLAACGTAFTFITAPSDEAMPCSWLALD